VPLMDAIYIRFLSSYASGIFWNYIVAIVIAVVPVVLAYAAVSRRLIDIGFILNRTVVFAIVSTIVIGTFILVEWAASVWLTGVTHTTSAVIGLVVALTLGLSLRYIHGHIDRIVDRVFFWKRHADEAALRGFAHESSYITDCSVLLERTVREVREHTGAESAAILLRDGSGSYVSPSNRERLAVSENDTAIIALRAWNRPVDLHALRETELRGEYAFPMISRGELVGALICGPKPDGELYAPDESDALLTLAHAVGVALDTMSTRTDYIVELVRATQSLMIEKFDALTSQVRLALPPNVQ
jgi:hypothetical protein